MNINSELLFFFSALGAFNGIVLSFYFIFFTKPNHISNKFLGLFLLMLSIRTGKSVFFYFNPDLSFHYLQFGLTACLFIGPFLYLYIKSVVKQTKFFQFEWKIHILLLVALSLIIGYLYPFKTHIDLWRPYFIKAIYYSWLIYTLLAGYLLAPILERALYNKTKTTSLDIWILSIFFGNLIVWAAYNYSRFTSYIVGALTFSFLFYIGLLFLFFNKKKRQILFSSVEKYADKKIANSKADELISQITTLMNKEELFKNANLKSAEVAKKANITTHQFSQLLNDNLGKNFASFVNEFRINEAKTLLKSDSKLTLEAIGYECVFNSKSTFYTTFKKLTGKTPSQFRSSNL